MNRIMLCKKCRIYTLKGYCPNCNEKTISPKPARFSPEDKYAKYRIEAKKEKGEF